MNRPSRIVTAALAVATLATTVAPRPALADGGASTRNIIFGAAAVGGTLLILNHNKKVHQKYAEYDQRQAATESQRNQAEAAYKSEKQAYAHEASLVGEYRKETAYQHSQVVARDRQIASLERSLKVAKYGAPRAAAFVAPAPAAVAAARAPRAQPPSRPAVAARPQVPQVSYGWGSY